MTDDSLISPKQPDGFTTESPIRAFTDFQVNGHYAVGKGFRPSLAHFSAYLDAMEAKEGWSFVQVIIPDSTGRDPTMIFRKVPRLRMFLTDRDGALREKPIPTIVSDEVDAYKDFADNLAVPDLGAPHDTMLNVKVTSNFGREHVSSAIYSKGAWWFATRMIGDEITATERMRGYPDAWQHPGQDGWNLRVPRRLAASSALGEPYKPADPRSKTLEAFRARTGGAPDDDPINPKHYGGTACAEIGELLTANSYQVLKYNWRLGGKDDESIEIGKSIWYLDREIALGAAHVLGQLPEHRFFDKRIADQSDHTKLVARTLISWNRYGQIASLHGLRKTLVRELDRINGVALDDGTTTGLAI
jgi:hypothetical protein